MKEQVSPNSAIPLYKQVAGVLARRIEAGEWQVNQRLPAEPVLMEEYGVSRVTVRSALAELVESGILVRSHGRGTFVAPAKDGLTGSRHVGFTRSCELAGKRATNRVLEAEMTFPTQQDIRFFRLDEADSVARIRRLRFVDDIPTMVETIHFAPQFQSILQEDLTGPISGFLAGMEGEQEGHTERTVEACLPEGDEPELLEIDVTTPLLLIRDRHFGADDLPIFLSKQVFCTNYLKLYL